jgi:hypothetical protein
MEHQLVISGGLFRSTLARLASGFPGRILHPAGVSRFGDQVEFLAGAGSGTESSVVIRSVERRERFDDVLRAEVGMRSGVALALGVGEAAGMLAGVRLEPDGIAPLNQVNIIEAGMSRIDLTPASRSVEDQAKNEPSCLGRLARLVNRHGDA